MPPSEWMEWIVLFTGKETDNNGNDKGLHYKLIGMNHWVWKTEDTTNVVSKNTKKNRSLRKRVTGTVDDLVYSTKSGRESVVDYVKLNHGTKTTETGKIEVVNTQGVWLKGEYGNGCFENRKKGTQHR